nr:DUF2274 domain-containing protein [Novosphingobium terrae]
MAELKLGKLPERVPVKLTISVTPDLHRVLTDYAAIYNQSYGREEPLVELVPHMLAVFLASDRAFAKARGTLGKEGSDGAGTN